MWPSYTFLRSACSSRSVCPCYRCIPARCAALWSPYGQQCPRPQCISRRLLPVAAAVSDRRLSPGAGPGRVPGQRQRSCQRERTLCYVPQASWHTMCPLQVARFMDSRMATPVGCAGRALMRLANSGMILVRNLPQGGYRDSAVEPRIPPQQARACTVECLRSSGWTRAVGRHGSWQVRLWPCW
jgi:hypothetical protein